MAAIPKYPHCFSPTCSNLAARFSRNFQSLGTPKHSTCTHISVKTPGMAPAHRLTHPSPILSPPFPANSTLFFANPSIPSFLSFTGTLKRISQLNLFLFPFLLTPALKNSRGIITPISCTVCVLMSMYKCMYLSITFTFLFPSPPCHHFFYSSHFPLYSRLLTTLGFCFIITFFRSNYFTSHPSIL